MLLTHEFLLIFQTFHRADFTQLLFHCSNWNQVCFQSAPKVPHRFYCSNCPLIVSFKANKVFRAFLNFLRMTSLMLTYMNSSWLLKMSLQIILKAGRCVLLLPPKYKIEHPHTLWCEQKKIALNCMLCYISYLWQEYFIIHIFSFLFLSLPLILRLIIRSHFSKAFHHESWSIIQKQTLNLNWDTFSKRTYYTPRYILIQ